MGRPRKLTHDIVKAIEDALLAGAHQDQACEYAGISRSAYYLWLKRGRETVEQGGPVDVVDQVYVDLLDAVGRSRAVAEVEHLQLIKRAAYSGSWQAAAWWLERAHPERWGRRQSGIGTQQPDLTPDQVRERLRELLAEAEQRAA